MKNASDQIATAKPHTMSMMLRDEARWLPALFLRAILPAILVDDTNPLWLPDHEQQLELRIKTAQRVA